MFMDSGEFLWNTGIFLSNVKYLRSCMWKVLPVVIRTLEDEGHDHTPEEEHAYIQENFPSYPNLSIDYGILEKNENVYVMKCDFGWADLGMWHSIYESWAKGEGDNVVIDSKVVLDDSRGNIIKLPADHVGVINGLENFIVAEKGNVLLICRKEDSSALVRKYISEVQIRFGEEFI
jgi:mannose-1-phosphate guanylyltransferase